MLKIGTKDDCEKLSELPPQIQREIEVIIAVLNFYYGEHRNIDKDMGGYVLLLQDESDYEKVEEIFNQSIDELIPEYVKMVEAHEQRYTISLIHCGSDFSITLVSSTALAPQTFFDYIESEEKGK